VEDSKGIRELIVDILTNAGYECRAVSSGREALARLNSGERFDLMLCDLLNNPHGINLLDRTQQNCPSMPVIIHRSMLFVHGTIRCQKHGSQRHSAETVSPQGTIDFSLGHACGSLNQSCHVCNSIVKQTNESRIEEDSGLRGSTGRCRLCLACRWDVGWGYPLS